MYGPDDKFHIVVILGQAIRQTLCAIREGQTITMPKDSFVKTFLKMPDAERCEECGDKLEEMGYEMS